MCMLRDEIYSFIKHITGDYITIKHSKTKPPFRKVTPTQK